MQHINTDPANQNVTLNGSFLLKLFNRFTVHLWAFGIHQSDAFVRHKYWTLMIRLIQVMGVFGFRWSCSSPVRVCGPRCTVGAG